MTFRQRATKKTAARGHYDIADVSASVNIVEIIGKFVQLRPKGHEHVGLCPFHTDRSPSFRVVPNMGANGRWHCFPCDEGGDVVDFIRKIKGCDYRQAARFLVGDDAIEFADADRARLKKEHAARALKEDELAKKKYLAALRDWKSARPIGGTPAEGYLRARGIALPLPSSLRFSATAWCSEAKSERPAMLAEMVDAKGAFAALHRTFLARSREGTWRKAALDAPKKILGRFMGSAIRLRDVPPGGTLYVAEGIETGLSVLAGILHRPDLSANAGVWAAGSRANLSRLALPVDDMGRCAIGTVVLCLDAKDVDDLKAGDTEAINAVLNYEPKGCIVKSVYWEIGGDFNDPFKAAAEEAAQAESGRIAS